MKKIAVAIFALCCIYTLCRAQNTAVQIDQIMNAPRSTVQENINAKLNPQVRDWVEENTLDSLDQEKIPKVVTSGLMLSANISNFLISSKGAEGLNTYSSYLRAGVEVGAFLDFLVYRNFAIQARLVFTAEQNHFGVGDSFNHLWNLGVDLPVLFMYRVGNLKKGYLNVGAGPYAHFTFVSNLGIYTNNEATAEGKTTDKDTDHPYYLTLHDNHAGIQAYIGYEFSLGISVGVNYMISLSDIFGYYKNAKGTTDYDMAFYPQKISMGVAYRWK